MSVPVAMQIRAAVQVVASAGLKRAGRCSSLPVVAVAAASVILRPRVGTEQAEEVLTVETAVTETKPMVELGAQMEIRGAGEFRTMDLAVPVRVTLRMARAASVTVARVAMAAPATEAGAEDLLEARMESWVRAAEVLAVRTSTRPT